MRLYSISYLVFVFLRRSSEWYEVALLANARLRRTSKSYHCLFLREERQGAAFPPTNARAETSFIALRVQSNQHVLVSVSCYHSAEGLLWLPLAWSVAAVVTQETRAVLASPPDTYLFT